MKDNRIVSYLPDEPYKWVKDLIEEKASSESNVVREIITAAWRKAKGKK